MSIVMLATSRLASAIEFIEEARAYHEDFQGESSYPLTPEENLLGASGLGAGDVNTRLPGLTGIAADFALTDLTVEPFVGHGLFTDLSAFANQSFGVRSRIAGISATQGDALFFTNGAAFDTSTLIPSAVTASFAFEATAAGSFEATLTVFERDGDLVVPNFVSVPLSSAEATALAAGAGLVFDTFWDRDANTIEASVEVDGFPPIFVGPMGVTVVSSPAVDLVGLGNSFGPGTAFSPFTLGLQQTSFSIYEPVTSSLTVDALADAVDQSPGDGLCETAVGECTLRAAIQESNAIPGWGEILLPSGVYALAITGIDEDAAATGDLDVLDSLVLRGSGRSSTLVDAASLDRVFDVPPSAAHLRLHLDDLTIQGGEALTLAPSDSFAGGGIRNWGWLEVERSHVRNNVALNGGGINNRGELVVEESVISENEARRVGTGQTYGGGISHESLGITRTAQLTLRRSAVVDNVVTGIGSFISGGLFVGVALPTRIENATISRNTPPQILVRESDTVLSHTLVSSAPASGPAVQIEPAGVFGLVEVDLQSAALDGSPACTLTGLFAFLGRWGYGGTSGATDTSCGIGSSGGSFEGIPLGVQPLGPIGESFAHLPLIGSPLLDRAFPSSPGVSCPSGDQLGQPRPVDADGSGSAECDIGPIELPEPRSQVMLGVGLLLHSLRAAHGRPRTRSRSSSA